MPGKNLYTRIVKKDLITMCAGCNSLKGKKIWIPYEFVSWFIDIPKLLSEMRISHSICKPCAIRIYVPAVESIFDK